MGNTREGKIASIILCVALILGVVINNKFSDRDVDVNVKAEEDKYMLLTDLEDDYEINQNDEFDIVYSQISNIKEYMLKENNEILYDDVEPNFQLLYVDALYKKELPTGIYTNMTEEFKNYIIDRYKTNYKEIKKIAILETTIEINEDKKLLMFGIRLDKISTADYGLVTVDLNTFDYKIVDVDI